MADHRPPRHRRSLLAHCTDAMAERCGVWPGLRDLLAAVANAAPDPTAHRTADPRTAARRAPAVPLSTICACSSPGSGSRARSGPLSYSQPRMASSISASRNSTARGWPASRATSPARPSSDSRRRLGNHASIRHSASSGSRWNGVTRAEIRVADSGSRRAPPAGRDGERTRSRRPRHSAAHPASRQSAKASGSPVSGPFCSVSRLSR